MNQIISFQGTPTALGMSLDHFGRTELDANEPILPHIHNNYEFHIVESGSAIYVVDEHCYPMSVGDICITRPGEFHRMVSTDGHPWSVSHINIRQMPSCEAESVLRTTSTKVLKGCGDLNPLFDRVFDEARNGQFESAMAVNAVVVGLLIAIARRLKSVEPVEFHLPYSQTVIKALRYFGGNCRYNVTINEIAQAINISPSRLLHVFKEEVGCTIRAYLRDLLMERARRMLEDDEYMVTEIARRLDFPRIACFSDFFRKYEGCSPSTYRAAWKGRIPSITRIR